MVLVLTLKITIKGDDFNFNVVHITYSHGDVPRTTSYAAQIRDRIVINFVFCLSSSCPCDLLVVLTSSKASSTFAVIARIFFYCPIYTLFILPNCVFGAHLTGLNAPVVLLLLSIQIQIRYLLCSNNILF